MNVLDKPAVAGLLAAVLLGSVAALPAMAAEVTPERLLNAAAEPQNWLMVHHTYDAHRYVALDMINRDNVAGLRPVFSTAVGGMLGGGNNPQGGHQATPLVDDGMMYFPDGWGAVYKVDVSQGNRGRISWIMDPGVDKAAIPIPANRGVALYRNFVISFTGDGQVLWTNADTGELLKSVKVDETQGYGLTLAPLIIGDKIIVGGGVGDFGIRSQISALNADSGEQIWRTYSVPDRGEPGSETWKLSGDAWTAGGGGFWVTGAYDPEQNVTIWGTGNPTPMFDPEIRPGDNLFTNSAIALDVETGAMKWYFQYTPGDFLDYDEIGVHLLIDTEINGETRKVVSHFGRNGFFYTLDRTNGQFINAGQYVQQVNWTDGIDPKTGKPVEYDPSKDLQPYKIGAPSRRSQGAIDACPNIQGGVNMFPTSYSEKTKLAYGSGLEDGCSTVTTDPSQAGMGGTYALAGRMKGGVSAVDPTTGQRVQQRILDYPSYSGVVSTAGGLVFTSSMDGTVYALDDTTLEPLWTYNFGSFSTAPPMTYAVGGKQYVAILAGGAAIAQATLGKSPEVADTQNSSVLYVFGL